MIPENGYAMPDGTKLQAPPPRRPPDRSVLALLRVGTRWCRLAAALMAVVVGLTSQIGDVAVAQAKQTLLYLDAPAVSAEHASRAGEVANAYSKPGSPASREVLAWLEVPVRPVDVSAPPEGATKAFAAITARDGEGAGGVTPDNALAAGEVMLAQLEGSPSQEDKDGGEELASSEAVRPQLGAGEQAPRAPETDDAEEQRPGDTDVPTYAGSSAYAATQGAAVPVEEPSGGSGVVIPTPSTVAEEATDEVPQQSLPTELASAPSGTGATPVLDPGTEEETYGPSGPVSDTKQASTILTPVDLEDVSPEDAGDGDEQSYPDESVPASEPEPVPDAVEEEPAGTEPMGEDAGPTSDGGEDLALVPVPPPADEEPAAAEDDYEQAEYRAPVALPNDGGEPEESVYAEPLPSTEAETAHAEPPPPTEEAFENPTEPDVPEATSAEIFVAEADEEQVETEIGGDETPVETSPEDEAPPAYVPPAEAPPGRKKADEDVVPYRDPRWGTEQEQTPADEPHDDSTQWDRPVEEDLPADREVADDAPLVEEPPHDVSPGGRPVDESPDHKQPEVVRPPEVMPPPEEQPFAYEEVSPEAAPGALPQEDATETPPEGQQPGSDYRPEDPEYAMGAPPGGPGAAQASQGTGQEEEQRGWDLRQDSPRRDQNRLPETDPTGPVDEQIGKNDGAGGTVPGHARNVFSQTAENASVIQQEQAVVIEEGGSPDGIGASELRPVPDEQTSIPEPLPQAAPRTIEEPVDVEPVPQVVPTPTQATAEEPVARQYDEPARPASARQYDPASQPATAAPASGTGIPTALEPAAPEQAPGQGADSRRSLAEPETDQRGGKENK